MVEDKREPQEPGDEIHIFIYWNGEAVESVHTDFPSAISFLAQNAPKEEPFETPEETLPLSNPNEITETREDGLLARAYHIPENNTVIWQVKNPETLEQLALGILDANYYDSVAHTLRVGMDCAMAYGGGNN